MRAYTRIIRLQKRNLDSLFLEKSLGLSQIQRGVIRRGVPLQDVSKNKFPTATFLPERRRGERETGRANQFVKKVILSEDMVALLKSILPLRRGCEGDGGEKACSCAAITLIKWSNGVISASLMGGISLLSAPSMCLDLMILEDHVPRHRQRKRAGSLAIRQAPACLLLLYLDQTTSCTSTT